MTHFNYLLDNALFFGASAFRLTRLDGVSGRD